MVCSEHFLATDFHYQWGRKLVKPDSVPTVFIYAPPTQKRKLPKERAIDFLSAEDSVAVSSSNVPPASNTTDISHKPLLAEHSYAIGSSPRKLHADNYSLGAEIAGEDLPTEKCKKT